MGKFFEYKHAGHKTLIRIDHISSIQLLDNGAHVIVAGTPEAFVVKESADIERLFSAVEGLEGQ